MWCVVWFVGVENDVVFEVYNFYDCGSEIVDCYIRVLIDVDELIFVILFY